MHVTFSGGVFVVVVYIVCYFFCCFYYVIHNLTVLSVWGKGVFMQPLPQNVAQLRARLFLGFLPNCETHKTKYLS